MSTYAAHEWEFLGEGMENIVLRYVGTQPQLQDKVLRIGKEVIKKQKALRSEINKQLSSNIFSEEQQIQFFTYVAKPCLGDYLCSGGHYIELDATFLEQIAIKIEHQRSEKRRAVSRLNQSALAGLLIENHTHISFSAIQGSTLTAVDDVFCIEIKPKWGSLPQSPYLAETLKKITCRYCLHQSLKLSEGTISGPSRYCPLDLYSGDEERMTLAISSLFKDPQNNLRVFKDSVVMPSQLDSLAETCSKLLSHFEGLSADAFMTKICVHILQKTKILQLLKKLQRLDSVDIEVISMLWDRSKTSDKPISDQEVLDQLQESLAKMKHRAILYDGEESTSDVCSRVVRSSNPITACMKDIPTWTRAEVLSMISDFLLATAMKDCSVMITFATFDRT
eukprot:TRINITY_DN2897_c0_g1_i8.p1 TRINITY_DN2897_c0_g1~~TRINITY_DN2897_c0_g1_i8.p1  ORF type:complete len:393 (-),score=77.57 TRINITY_DN2897_c0_g1_i8:635-1813(-)